MLLVMPSVMPSSMPSSMPLPSICRAACAEQHTLSGMCQDMRQRGMCQAAYAERHVPSHQPKGMCQAACAERHALSGAPSGMCQAMCRAASAKPCAERHALRVSMLESTCHSLMRLRKHSYRRACSYGHMHVNDYALYSYTTAHYMSYITRLCMTCIRIIHLGITCSCARHVHA